MVINLYQQIPVCWQEYFNLCGENFVLEIKHSLKTIEENLELWKKENPEREIFPPQFHWFEALSLINPKQVKVVILGQDPYHGSQQAHGLAFSVLNHQKIPPSLKNIFQELINEKEIDEIPTHGNLTSWAKQGILLLNHTLTVANNEANSHDKIGWENFTNLIIESLNLNPFVIYCLWGNFAQKKESLITNQHHIILKSGHPSPLSIRYFKGCGHFKIINQLLQEKNLEPIHWQLNNKNTNTTNTLNISNNICLF